MKRFLLILLLLCSFRLENAEAKKKKENDAANFLDSLASTENSSDGDQSSGVLKDDDFKFDASDSESNTDGVEGQAHVDKDILSSDGLENMIVGKKEDSRKRQSKKEIEQPEEEESDGSTTETNERKKKELFKNAVEPQKFKFSHKDCTKGWCTFNVHRDKPFTEFRPSARPVCGEDIDEFCSDVDPGNHRIRECLHGVKNRITASCLFRLAYEDKKRSTGSFELHDEENTRGRRGHPCDGDSGVFCGGLDPRSSKGTICLAQNIDKLTIPCVKHMEPEFARFLDQEQDSKPSRRIKKEPEIHELLNCKKEIRGMCRREETDDHILMCLVENIDRVSEECKHDILKR